MHRMNNLADRMRVALVVELAPDGMCAECGTAHAHEKLEIDHVDGAGWSRRSLSRIARSERYWEEYRTGVRLRALCRTCNAVDGNRKKAAMRLAQHATPATAEGMHP